MEREMDGADLDDGAKELIRRSFRAVPAAEKP